MSTPLRLGAFGLVLAVALAGGAALGTAVGPIDDSEPSVHGGGHDDPGSSAPDRDTGAHDDHGSGADDPTRPPADAFRLELGATVVAAGAPSELELRVVGPAEEVVTEFDVEHERRMHLIVVSNDLADYAHLHPVLGDDGTWTVELPALAPGGHRLIADTHPTGGPTLALTGDVVVPGAATGEPLPAPATTTKVDDLEVAVATTPNADGLGVELTVRRDGVLVEPDPYLGARGHLVAIDADDLDYLHVHPTEDEGRPGTVAFEIADPAPGRYRLFFDVSVDGVVRTAAFTLDVPDGTRADGTHSHAPGEEHG